MQLSGAYLVVIVPGEQRLRNHYPVAAIPSLHPVKMASRARFQRPAETASGYDLFSGFRFQDIAHKDGRYPPVRVNVLFAGLQLAGFEMIPEASGPTRICGLYLLHCCG
jgi:hypothetical protein